MTQENSVCVSATARLTIFLEEGEEGGIKIIHEDVCR